MCRLLGVVTREPMPLVAAVPRELPLFTALSEKHRAGWGVAWYVAEGDAAGESTAGDDEADDVLVVDRQAAGVEAAAVADGEAHVDDLSDEAVAAFEEAPYARESGTDGLRVRLGTDTALASNEYGDALAEAWSDLAIVHLRTVPPVAPPSLVNTHPFIEGGVAFAHNGVMDRPDGLTEAIVARGGRPPVGDTDSELLFSLIELHAREVGWAGAIQIAAVELTDILTSLGARIPRALNCLVITPDALHTYAQSDPAQMPDAATWDTYDLMLLAEDDRVVVSSSGYEWDAFDALEEGTVATVSRETLEVTILPPLEQFVLAPSRVAGRGAWIAERRARGIDAR